TPSRNASLHPQASRACVNPFNMMTGSYYKRRPRGTPAQEPARPPAVVQNGYYRRHTATAFCAAGALQQRLDLPLELGLARNSHVFLADLPVAPDDERRRDAPERPERILHVVATEADEHRIIHLVLRGVGFDLVDRVVDREPEDDEIFRVL